MGDEAFLTSSDVALKVGVARQTVARWIREGKLPARHIRVGSRAVYRIRRKDFAAFLLRYVHDDW